jgi:hypothetical protein
VQREAVVVLGREDNVFASGPLGDAGPFLREARLGNEARQGFGGVGVGAGTDPLLGSLHAAAIADLFALP